jgi:hypothetical protein
MHADNVSSTVYFCLKLGILFFFACLQFLPYGIILSGRMF